MFVYLTLSERKGVRGHSFGTSEKPYTIAEILEVADEYCADRRNQWTLVCTMLTALVVWKSYLLVRWISFIVRRGALTKPPA
jgi:hypothetical protein